MTLKYRCKKLSEAKEFVFSKIPKKYHDKGETIDAVRDIYKTGIAEVYFSKHCLDCGKKFIKKANVNRCPSCQEKYLIKKNRKKAPKKTFSEYDKKYIKENKESLSNSDIASHLNRTSGSIKNYIYRTFGKRGTLKVIPQETKIEIIEDIKKLDRKGVMQKYNICSATYYRFKKESK
jgi:DNA-directed RNA polymerase subunit RPC12/RpoP